MKQVLQAVRGGKTRVADVPAPGLRPGGVLVRTRWSLVSAGTERLVIDLAGKSLVGKAVARPDLVRKTLDKVKREGVAAAWRTVSGRLAGDVPLGYSAAGDVVAVDESVAGSAADGGIRVGDRVACAGSGFASHAEILSVPRNLCARVPDGVDLRHASAATLGAIAMHGVRTADLRLGETAVVVGLGLLGQLTVQMLRASGVRVVAVDRDAARAALAGTLGASAALGPDEDAAAAVLALTGGHGADGAIVCAASETSAPLTLAASLCRRRGVVTLVGALPVEVDRRLLYEKELTLRMSTSYGPGRYDPVYEERGVDYPYAHVRWTEGRNLAAVLDLVARGALKLDPLLTHTFPIERAEEAYALVRGEKAEPFLGILLRYDGEVPARLQPATVPASAAKRPRGDAVRLGVAGAGQFAVGVLLPAFRAAGGATFEAVSSASGATADAARRTFGFRKAVSSASDAIHDGDVDLALVLTRHDSHAALVLEALNAGKPCFVEKPLAIRREDLLAVADAAAAAKSPWVCVGFNRRFAPAVVALRKALGRGDTRGDTAERGPLHFAYRVNAGSLPAGHWTLDPEVGGGRILGEACHFVDLVTHLAGSRVVRVVAERLPDDGAAVLLRLADGSTAALEYATTGDPALGKERIEVHGGGTSFVLDDFRSLVRARSGRRAEIWSGSQDKGHRAEAREVLRAVREGLPPPVPLDEALASTDATFAVLESIASGSAVDLAE